MIRVEVGAVIPAFGRASVEVPVDIQDMGVVEIRDGELVEGAAGEEERQQCFCIDRVDREDGLIRYIYISTALIIS